VFHIEGITTTTPFKPTSEHMMHVSGYARQASRPRSYSYVHSDYPGSNSSACFPSKHSPLLRSEIYLKSLLISGSRQSSFAQPAPSNTKALSATQTEEQKPTKKAPHNAKVPKGPVPKVQTPKPSNHTTGGNGIQSKRVQGRQNRICRLEC